MRLLCTCPPCMAAKDPSVVWLVLLAAYSNVTTEHCGGLWYRGKKGKRRFLEGETFSSWTTVWQPISNCPQKAGPLFLHACQGVMATRQAIGFRWVKYRGEIWGGFCGGRFRGYFCDVSASVHITVFRSSDRLLLITGGSSAPYPIPNARMPASDPDIWRLGLHP